MKISTKGIQFLSNEEGCILHTYRCQAGILTIGYGSTGFHVKEGMIITKDEALALLGADLVRFELVVNKSLHGTIVTQSQFDSLCSIAFNIGDVGYANSTLARLIGEGIRDKVSIYKAFCMWCRISGTVNDGLLARRKREATLFFK